MMEWHDAGNGDDAVSLRVLALGALVPALLIATGCGAGDDESGGGTVEVALTNWAISPSDDSVQAGTVRFRAVHEEGEHGHGVDEGGQIHELAVARKKADGKYEILGAASEIGVGEEKELTLELEPGEYELQCNVAEVVNGEVISHYERGMRVGFRVT